MVADAIIVGAGACGLMCAVQAGYLGKKVLLLEKNKQPGAKILISGGGRCNYTNLFTTAEQFISANPHFIKYALGRWTVEDTISFFELNGIPGAEKTLGQLFPANGNAKDVVRLFTRLCADFGQEIRCGAEVKDIRPLEQGFEVEYEKDGRLDTVSSPKVVIASGGLPIPKMGASDFALRWGRKQALKIVETAPALVPLTITGKDESWYAQLSGNSVFASVGNERIDFEENVLFTHWGLSGPAVLQISSYWRRGETISLNLLPGKDIVPLLEQERKSNGGTLLAAFLQRFVTRRFSEALGKFLPLSKTVAALTKEEINRVYDTIHRFTVKPAGDKGYDKAEVMRGGIDTNELWPKTLACRKIPGLYFGGECVDVTGWLGGYNFQWAWASGFLIAQDL
ncbi:aminoacetone oxidase family FAD-binding enzyme [Pedobacter yulinensis]|uniref:Aminoacetone oxidase family FAD-binding enzyme n=1 Tax=Pedobacter yulinensis TaxID=2126353 RepID=A0A2T3HKM4_9SPHI|nr:aminoacetone oxidase family FAD-binding enzyme [Pedobacter yulinensis]PST82969.1 aminoacetone oxidase family FAD-binding enzyme [Pedobacter yulinensis]